MTHILGLRALADFIEKSRHFDQTSGLSCTIGHAFRLALVPDYRHYDTSATALYDRASALLGIRPDEAEAIWRGEYPNRLNFDQRQTRDIAVEHLRQLADRYEPASPIDAKPKAAPSPTEAQPMPLLVLDRELVPA